MHLLSSSLFQNDCNWLNFIGVNELYLTIALYFTIAFFLPIRRVILDRTLEIAYCDDIYIDVHRK